MIPNVKLTTAGAALLAKTPEGYPVPATRWQIGKGALPSGSSLDRTALVDPVEYLDLYKVQNQGTESLILGQFTNQGMESGFPFEEVGLLAQDPDVGEILMCYGNAFGAGEEIQPEAVQLREFIFGTQLKFSGEANMSGEIEQGLVFIPLAQKGQPDGVTPLGPDGLVPEQYLPELNKLDAVIQVTYNGAQPANPVAVHNAAPLSHQNLYVDGNNVTSADNSATLEEHMANPMAHQNLVIDGNAGQ